MIGSGGYSLSIKTGSMTTGAITASADAPAEAVGRASVEPAIAVDSIAANANNVRRNFWLPETKFMWSSLPVVLTDGASPRLRTKCFGEGSLYELVSTLQNFEYDVPIAIQYNSALFDPPYRARDRRSPQRFFGSDCIVLEPARLFLHGAFRFIWRAIDILLLLHNRNGIALSYPSQEKPDNGR